MSKVHGVWQLQYCTAGTSCRGDMGGVLYVAMTPVVEGRILYCIIRGCLISRLSHIVAEPYCCRTICQKKSTVYVRLCHSLRHISNLRLVGLHPCLQLEDLTLVFGGEPLLVVKHLVTLSVDFALPTTVEWNARKLVCRCIGGKRGPTTAFSGNYNLKSPTRTGSYARFFIVVPTPPRPVHG